MIDLRDLISKFPCIHQGCAILTVPHTAEGLTVVDRLRQRVREHNKNATTKLVVRIKGRLGKNNPNRSHPCYARGTAFTRNEHAVRFDVYVNPKDTAIYGAGREIALQSALRFV